MEKVIALIVLAIVGFVLGWFADKIFKGKRPNGLNGDIAIGVITAVVVGALDFFVIPAMGIKSQLLIWVAVVFEPALSALFVLWLVRKAKR